jgi:HAD superfamily phosphoserine phosphatase-like hydrolase
MSIDDEIAIFDFDKTLIGQDSFRLFGSLAARSGAERLLLFLYAVACRLGWISNERYKELVLGRVWQPRSADQRDVVRDELAAAMRAIAIESAMARLRQHLAEGHRVAIFSASPLWYLEPFVHSISPDISVFGSDIEERDGAVHVDNLFRERKAEKAREFVAQHAASRVSVYTDHKDDLELMRLGDRVTLVRPSQATLDEVRRAGIEFEVIAS